MDARKAHFNTYPLINYTPYHTRVTRIDWQQSLVKAYVAVPAQWSTSDTFGMDKSKFSCIDACVYPSGCTSVAGLLFGTLSGYELVDMETFISA